MLTRIGDLAQSTRATTLLLEAQTRSRAAQTQISSGKVAARFQDIAPDAERLVSTKTMLLQTQQFQASNAIANQRMRAMEVSLGSIIEIATRFKVLLLQRLNEATAVPGVITPEAELMLDQTVGDLNVKLDDKFLMAGSRTDTAPVALDPAFANFGAPDDTYYQGDGVQLTVSADQELQVPYGMSADRPGFQELIGALRTAIEADSIDDRALLQDALDLVTTALPKISEYRSELGARQARLDQINLLHSETEVYLENRISDIEDVDLAAAVTRLSQDQILIESAMVTIGRLAQLSLADFLR